ncbi:hypothetical protein OROMI_016760 [Orobanche minor]
MTSEHFAHSWFIFYLTAEQVKSECPKITYADLYQTGPAGVVTVEVTGRPVINFVPGRKDLKILQGKGVFQMLIQATQQSYAF